MITSISQDECQIPAIWRRWSSYHLENICRKSGEYFSEWIYRSPSREIIRKIFSKSPDVLQMFTRCSPDDKKITFSRSPHLNKLWPNLRWPPCHMEVLILQTASKSPPDYANVKSGKYSPDQLAGLLIRWDDLKIASNKWWPNSGWSGDDL